MPYGTSPLQSVDPKLTSIAKAQAAFDAGQPFDTPWEGYTNKAKLMRDFPNLTTIEVHYGKNNTKTNMLTIEEK